MEGAPFDRKSERDDSEHERAKGLVEDALKNLEGEGRRIYDSLFEINLPHEEFAHRIREFNNLPAGERGKGSYDHDRSLAEREDAAAEHTMTFPPGRRVTVMLDKDGGTILSFIA